MSDQHVGLSGRGVFDDENKAAGIVYLDFAKAFDWALEISRKTGLLNVENNGASRF